VWAKRFTLPGLDGVSIYNVVRLLIIAIDEGVIAQRAAAISFNFFLALFPSVLVLFTLIPYVPIPNFQAELLDVISWALPEGTDSSVFVILNDIITRQQGDVLSLGFFLALFFATNGFKSIIVAFNSSIHINDERSFLSLQWVALVLTAIFSVMMLITVSGILFNQYVLSILIEFDIMREGLYYLILIINWLLLLGMIFFMVSFLYYFAPKSNKRFRLISAGSTISTVVIVVVVFLFDLYITNFNKYNLLYGSIGTLLIVLMWIYTNSFILLLGFEINSSIIEGKRQKLGLLERISKIGARG
jgi:membrane protein